MKARRPPPGVDALSSSHALVIRVSARLLLRWATPLFVCGAFRNNDLGMMTVMMMAGWSMVMLLLGNESIGHGPPGLPGAWASRVAHATSPPPPTSTQRSSLPAFLPLGGYSSAERPEPGSEDSCVQMQL
jgi:hypothetical protein